MNACLNVAHAVDKRTEHLGRHSVNRFHRRSMLESVERTISALKRDNPEWNPRRKIVALVMDRTISIPEILFGKDAGTWLMAEKTSSELIASGYAPPVPTSEQENLLRWIWVSFIFVLFPR